MRAVPRFEKASFSQVTVTNTGMVQKVMRHPFRTAEEAEAFCSRLAAYQAELAEGPIAVAPFCGATVVKEATGDYRVRHEQELIPGPSVRQLSGPERADQMVAIVAALLAAPTLPGDARKQRTPVDAKVTNYHLDEYGNPVLTDICPPFYWDTDGTVTYGLASRDNHIAAEMRTADYGLTAGVVARTIYSGLEYDTHAARRDQVRAWLAAPDGGWYGDLLPAGTSDAMRVSVHTYMRNWLAYEFYGERAMPPVPPLPT